jgi:CheY-like chemotaxis protein
MKSILIVDDDLEVIDLVKNRLEANNFQVFTATNGKEGIQEAQQQKPDLIIMDILMPEMSGGDVVKFLKSDIKTKHIPVVFLTAVTAHVLPGPAAQNVCVDGQFYPAVIKPFDPAKLLYEINRHLDEY